MLKVYLKLYNCGNTKYFDHLKNALSYYDLKKDFKRVAVNWFDINKIWNDFLQLKNAIVHFLQTIGHVYHLVSSFQ